MARNGRNTHATRGDDRQTAVLADMPPAKETGGAKAPKPIQLPTAHDVTITYAALEHRVEKLKKLEKLNTNEGYRREARGIRADIDAITEHVIPAFRSQRELPLATEEDAERAIIGGIRTTVFRAFDGLDDPKVPERFTPASIQRRREELLRTLEGRIYSFAADLYADAYNAGYAARKTDPDVLIANAAKSLSTEVLT